VQSFKTGLIGAGIQASRSPFLHMQEARALGLDLDYRLFDARAGDFAPEALGALLDRLQDEGYAGVNITHPFKQQVLAHLDSVSPDAEALGAVNTVVFGKGGRIGHNTDWLGWSEGFRRELPRAKLNRVVLLGAGGAGSAVAYAALRLGVREVVVRDLDARQVESLCAKLGARFGEGRIRPAGDLVTEIAGADGVVNTTPVGMAAYPGTPLPFDLLRRDLWVAEVIYFPLQTALLAAARALGCPTVGGGPMVVFQAAEAFRLFTGVKPDAERMFAAFTAAAVEEV
jgi:shikimate dehydrogenase